MRLHTLESCTANSLKWNWSAELKPTRGQVHSTAACRHQAESPQLWYCPGSTFPKARWRPLPGGAGHVRPSTQGGLGTPTTEIKLQRTSSYSKRDIQNEAKGNQEKVKFISALRDQRTRSMCVLNSTQIMASILLL